MIRAWFEQNRLVHKQECLWEQEFHLNTVTEYRLDGKYLLKQSILQNPSRTFHVGKVLEPASPFGGLFQN